MRTARSIERHLHLQAAQNQQPVFVRLQRRVARAELKIGLAVDGGRPPTVVNHAVGRVHRDEALRRRRRFGASAPATERRQQRQSERRARRGSQQVAARDARLHGASVWAGRYKNESDWVSATSSSFKSPPELAKRSLIWPRLQVSAASSSRPKL